MYTLAASHYLIFGGEPLRLLLGPRYSQASALHRSLYVFAVASAIRDQSPLRFHESHTYAIIQHTNNKTKVPRCAKNVSLSKIKLDLKKGLASDTARQHRNYSEDGRWYY